MSPPYRVMGVVNVTPDSFSDGGAFLDAGAAVAHALGLVAQGADILDVGGESTRPGAEPVLAEEELRRVLPVLDGIAAAGEVQAVQLSIDTSKADVARAAIAAGASIVNDVTALRGDPGMVELVAESEVECCLMHMLGEPRTMQRAGRAGGPRYKDVVDEVKAFLEQRLEFAVRAGVGEERVMLDPGIGFGKTVAHNLELLDRLDELTVLGRPLVVGTSRKSFLGRILADAAGEDEPVATERRLPGTIATNVLALERGARVFRVHDVAPVRAALAVAAATLGGRWTARGTTTQTS
ncbi:MAG TPA: dihydropteroate synthase [Solirubrobacteraceae bacterium]|jgi:dihydropteroate synthase|nr:dihydropteroate synthase [Solirubrobacteraceae bacterium]